MMVPFIDRGSDDAYPSADSRRRCRRVRGSGLGGIYRRAAIRSTPPTAGNRCYGNDGPGGWQQLSPEDVAAIGYYRKENCATLPYGRPEVESRVGCRAKAYNGVVDRAFRESGPGGGSSSQINNFQMNSLAALSGDPHSRTVRRPSMTAQQAPVEGAMIYQAQPLQCLPSGERRRHEDRTCAEWSRPKAYATSGWRNTSSIHRSCLRARQCRRTSSARAIWTVSPVTCSRFRRSCDIADNHAMRRREFVATLPCAAMAQTAAPGHYL